MQAAAAVAVVVRFAAEELAAVARVVRLALRLLPQAGRQTSAAAAEVAALEAVWSMVPLAEKASSLSDMRSRETLWLTSRN
jgi:hypothetical protein